MDIDSMFKHPWTDAKMFAWTIGAQDRKIQYDIRPYDREAYQFWKSLRKFSVEKDLLEKNFIGRLKEKQIHSLFWELYLSKFFYEKDIKLLKQKISNSKYQPSFPDFYFERNSKKIWIEAAVVGDAEGGLNDSLEDKRSDFEKSIQREDDPLKLRLTNVINGKISKYKLATEKNPLIIAFNGYKAVGGQADPSDFPEMPWPSRIESVLFGTGNFYIEYKNGKRNIGLSIKKSILKNDRASVDVGYFAGPEFSHISGIIYSNVYLWQCNMATHPLGHDFIYISNPYALYDLGNIFDFCHQSRFNK